MNKVVLLDVSIDIHHHVFVYHLFVDQIFFREDYHAVHEDVDEAVVQLVLVVEDVLH